MSSAQIVDDYEAPGADLYEVNPDERTGLLSFKGRLSVLSFMAQTFLWMTGLFTLLGIFYVALESIESLSELGFGIVFIVLLASLIPVMWIGCALMAKRLHDMNMSGWHMLFTFVPVVGWLYWLYISFTPGIPEPNRFGRQTLAVAWEKPVGIVGVVMLVLLVATGLFIDGAEMFASS